MGMKVLVYDVIDIHDRAAELGYQQVSLDELLAQADSSVCICPHPRNQTSA